MAVCRGGSIIANNHAHICRGRRAAICSLVVALAVSGCGLFDGDAAPSTSSLGDEEQIDATSASSTADSSDREAPDTDGANDVASLNPAASAPVALGAGVTRLTAPGAVELAATAATGFFSRAPMAVVTDGRDPAEAEVAAWLAVRLRAPFLILPPPVEVAVSPSASGAGSPSPSGTTSPPPDPRAAVTAALQRLDVRAVVAVGEVAAPDEVDELRTVSVSPGEAVAGDVPWWRRVGAMGVGAAPLDADFSEVRDLLTRAPQSRAGTGVHTLVRPAGGSFAAATSAVAAGHRLVPFVASDPRSDPLLRRWLPEGPADTMVLLGREGTFDRVAASDLPWQLAVARKGLELPGGGQLMFPQRRLVALYGNPQTDALGVLGEQGVEAAIDRARRLAAEYEPYSEVPVIPSFEIIATVASASASPDGDYSHPAPMDLLEEWVDAAGRAGVYVLLDLQPGRTDFLTQAQMFERFLRQPHVGLALDPEWRLEPDEVHLRQIGSVAIAEVQRVVDWLAELTRSEALPQKLLLLHQFRLSMLPGREQLDTPTELSIAIQMDGQGPQSVKLETWRAVTRSNPPDNVWFGWKNFYDEDTPTRSPADTMALDPKPVFVSYQ